MEEQNLMPFEGKPIRKVWHNDQWYFSIRSEERRVGKEC